MRFEQQLYVLQAYANARRPDKVVAGGQLPRYETVRDAEGTKVVPRTTPTLIERLIARSAGKTLAVPKAKKRGRPRKGGAE